MNISAALTAFALLAVPARSQDAPALEEMAPPLATPGWTRQSASLLLYGQDGSLSKEIPLRAPDEGGTTSRETLGGVSPDGRLAWTLDRRQTWNQDRTRLLDSRRLFKTYGTTGSELWHDDAVDMPERGDPILFSADGLTLLLARRAGGQWTAEARTWLGRPLLVIGPFPHLVSMALTPNGRYALARWSVTDKSDTHTFVDLSTLARKDIESGDLVLGLARIGDDGVARSGSKVVFSFETASSTAAAPAVSTPTSVSTPTAPAPPPDPR